MMTLKLSTIIENNYFLFLLLIYIFLMIIANMFCMCISSHIINWESCCLIAYSYTLYACRKNEVRIS